MSADRAVDQDDLSSVLGDFGECPEGELCWNDFNNDQVVDTTDLGAVIESYGLSESTDAAGIDIEYFNAWLAAGGEDAIQEHEVDAAKLADALAHSLAAERVTAMFALLD